MNEEPYLTTLSKKRVHFLNPRPGEIEVLDLATGISREGRYSNQTQERYYVAQHCLGVAHLRGLFGPEHNSPSIRLQALVHDLGEGLMRDIPSPLKRCIPDYSRIEEHFQSCIFRELGLPDKLDPFTKQCDLALLVAESRDLGFEIDYVPSKYVLTLSEQVPTIVPKQEEELLEDFMWNFNMLASAHRLALVSV